MANIFVEVANKSAELANILPEVTNIGFREGWILRIGKYLSESG